MALLCLANRPKDGLNSIAGENVHEVVHEYSFVICTQRSVTIKPISGEWTYCQRMTTDYCFVHCFVHCKYPTNDTNGKVRREEM
jgi:hypothetical protein